MNSNAVKLWLPALIFIAIGISLRIAGLNRPFWMDESYSSSLAGDTPSKIISICRKDVHPPGYFLVLSFWNKACRVIGNQAAPIEPWELVDFNVSFIETAGEFKWVDLDGDVILNTGIFPEQWRHRALAPLKALRLLSVFFGGIAAFLTWRLAALLAPEACAVRVLAVGVFCLSGYTLTWDTVIRSYSAGAAATVALALTALWGAQSGRWKIAGGAIALLLPMAFLTNYVTLLQFPGIALAAWIWGGADRKTFIRVAGCFLCGLAITGLLWGMAFIKQTGRVPSQAVLSMPFMESFLLQFSKISQCYWSMVFSEGVWRWLAAGTNSADLNPLLSLSPVNVILYSAAFLAYGAAIGANVWDCCKHRSKTILILALLAFLPGAYVILGNIIKPDFFRIHARHLYCAAPFLYIFLAKGWVSLASKIPRIWSQS